ncbi:MAG: GIY-YIG nuclease family protein [Candidatus Methylomirabilales bacterium]
MLYTYVLFSDRDGRLYTGTTGVLRQRIRQHAEGKVRSTAYRRPLKLIYYEACLNAEDAYCRERFLKTGKGKRYLKNRLASCILKIRTNKSRSSLLERDGTRRNV